jgi:hypothetical protein
LKSPFDLPRIFSFFTQFKGSIGIKAKNIPLAGKKELPHCSNVSIECGEVKITNYMAQRDEFAEGE